MKILWLSHLVPYPPKGGVLQRSYHLLKQTCKHHDVHLLAFNQNDLIRPLFSSVEQGLSEATEHLEKYCESVQFFPIPNDKSKVRKYFTALSSLVTSFPYTLNWLQSAEYSNAIQEILIAHEFDMVHFDTISLAPFLPLCGNIPTSLDHHNIESHMLIRRSQKESNIIKKIYYLQEGKRLEKFEKKYCPMFSFNFTCSELDSERLKEISPTSMVETIPNGVDVDYFAPSSSRNKKNSLLFIGTLSWYPNIEAVEYIAKYIWPKIKLQFPEVIVDIVGANPPQSILDISKKDPNFRVHGFVDDILPFFDNAKCYICPIKDGGGTKLKILDALSMGMAIVADEIACEGIDVTNDKDVFFAENPDEYVNAISKVFDDPEKRTLLESNARSLALQTYSYESIGKQLSNFFSQYAQ